MVTEGRVAPEPVLDPKRAVEDRVILLRRREVRPDAREAGARLQLGRGEVGLIVPEAAAVEGRPVAAERDDEKERAQQPAAGAGGVGSAGELHRGSYRARQRHIKPKAHTFVWFRGG